MKPIDILLFVISLLFITGTALSESTPILIGGEDTELSPDGVISGNGSSEWGGLGAAVLDTFNIYYQPLGEGDFVDNLFPDHEVYSFQMNIPDGLPNYQSQGQHGSFWDSGGRNDEGILPWVNRNWRGGQYYDARYQPAGDESPFGLVSDTVHWTIDYWDVEEDDDEEICFIHTCLAGMVRDFHYNEDTGNATALLVLLNTAYLGYGDDGEPGPGAVEYEGGVYQGFDSFRERSGLLDYPAFFFQYDGEENTGSLTPCGTKVTLKDEDGWVKGYFDVIQEAIDASENGNIVQVSPGEYFENLTVGNKSIVLTGDPANPEEVIIDGAEEGSVIRVGEEDTDNVFLIDGFTITNGAASDGGGIVAFRCDITIRNCIITGNSAEDEGGGLYLVCSKITVIETAITMNSALLGGGVAGGAGLDSLCLFERCLIAGNEAVGAGAAKFWCPGDYTLVNCTVADNIDTGHQVIIHGLWFIPSHDDYSIMIVNSILCGNGETQVFVNPGNANLIIEFSDVEGGEDGFNIEEVGEFVWGDGNIDEDPLFVDPDEGNYHLTEDSPCIDTGDPESDPNPDGTRADMGAFYFHQFGQYIDVPDDFETIQAAIDASEDGDTILVHPGIYIENIDFIGKDIVLGSLYITAEDEAYIDSTVIDGDSSSTVVTFADEENEDALLIGLTIQNGYREANGGGIRCSNSSPTIRNCKIHNNAVGTRGGGISCEPNANPVISDCEIFENTSNSGGAGIWCGDNSSPTISGCGVYNNEAGWNGGGMNMYINCDPVIENCVFEENIAHHKGGGIIVSQDCSPLITNCRILDNLSVDNGGGITVERNATPVIRNCLFEDNETEDEKGGAIAAIENASPVIVNCTFDWEARWGWYTAIYLAGSSARIVNSNMYGLSPLWISFDPDSAASSIMIACSNIQDGQESIVTNDNGEVHWEEGNIDADPLFVDREEGDYRLLQNSPCIDAGTAFFVWEEDTLVYMSEDEYSGEAPDMGAYESDFDEIPEGALNLHPSSYILHPPHPNPFNSTTFLRFDLPVAGLVKLIIFDLNGRKVITVTNDWLKTGYYKVSLNADNLPSGIYLARFEAAGFTQTVKLMLLK
ncbi:MAG: right-handed parallel beta-helix repeat-containing protein [Candidatus Hatepunaea meridiana]|nr:right-handed parallel beta-helix repeat-containing protein [Candidatus Hatepunaea meridiana]